MSTKNRRHYPRAARKPKLPTWFKEETELWGEYEPEHELTLEEEHFEYEFCLYNCCKGPRRPLSELTAERWMKGQ